MLTRREALARAGRWSVLALAGTALAACSDDGGGEGGGIGEEPARRVALRLPDYPFAPGTAVVPAPTLLNRLATEYATEQGDADLDMARFLHAYVPGRVIDEVLTVPADEVPAGRLLWLGYVSGYFAGLWLRDRIAAAQPGALLVTYSAPLSSLGFLQLAARAELGLDAARARRADAVLAFNAQSLFNQSNPAAPEQPFWGLADTFGYEQGALRQIVAEPPLGATPPDQVARCRGPLSCSYDGSRLAALDELAPIQAALDEGETASYRRLAREIEPVQLGAIARGRRVWSGDPGLSAAGFPDAAYQRLVETTRAGLQQAQASALAAAGAVAEEDDGRGRQAAIAAAVIGIKLGGYQAGLRDGRPDRAQPRFVERG